MHFQGLVRIPKPSTFVLGARIMQNDELSSTWDVYASGSERKRLGVGKALQEQIPQL